jgi:hypothetical protein
LIRQSDVVWIASAWSPWEARLLKESLSNLNQEYGEKFVVFGSKNFGAIDIKRLMSIAACPARYARPEPGTRTRTGT